MPLGQEESRPPDRSQRCRRTSGWRSRPGPRRRRPRPGADPTVGTGSSDAESRRTCPGTSSNCPIARAGPWTIIDSTSKAASPTSQAPSPIEIGPRAGSGLDRVRLPHQRRSASKASRNVGLGAGPGPRFSPEGLRLGTLRPDHRQHGRYVQRPASPTTGRAATRPVVEADCTPRRISDPDSAGSRSRVQRPIDVARRVPGSPGAIGGGVEGS